MQAADSLRTTAVPERFFADLATREDTTIKEDGGTKVAVVPENKYDLYLEDLHKKRRPRR